MCVCVCVCVRACVYTYVCMCSGSQHWHVNILDVKEAHDMSAQQKVSMFCMLAQKAAIRPDRVEHFTHREIVTGNLHRYANCECG